MCWFKFKLKGVIGYLRGMFEYFVECFDEIGVIYLVWMFIVYMGVCFGLMLGDVDLMWELDVVV